MTETILQNKHQHYRELHIAISYYLSTDTYAIETWTTVHSCLLTVFSPSTEYLGLNWLEIFYFIFVFSGVSVLDASSLVVIMDVL